MIRLLLVGSGNIAGHHATEFGKLDGCTVSACVDAVPGKAAAFAEKHGIGRAFESLDEAIASGGFDAAVNGTPDGVHKDTTLPLIAAGRPVLCEKPLAPNYPDALAMTEAAETAGVVNMVNLSYRNAAALQRARELVRDGAIGTLRHVQASYRQSWLVSKAWGDWRAMDQWLWRLSTAHGSNGVLGDVGVHIIDFALFGADDEVASLRADLVTFPKAEGDRIGAYRLDANDSVAITARLARSGALATITATRFATGHLNDLSLELHGTKGALRVTTDGGTSALAACLGDDVEDAGWQVLPAPPVPTNARRFLEAVRSGRNGEPSFRRAAEMQKLIDAAAESSARGVALEP